MKLLNALTGEIVGAAIEVHRELGGPGSPRLRVK